MGGGPPPGMIPPAGTYPAGPPRPFTAMSDSSPSRRPSGAGGQPYGPPPQQQGYPPHSPEAGYPGGFNGETVPRIHTPKPPGLPSGPAPVNIGFEAPERPKPSKTAPPSGPIAPPPSNNANPGRPGTSQGPAPPRQQQQQQQQPMAPQHGGGQAGHELFDGPPTPTNKTQRPTTAESAPKPVSAPLPKPPGKGPKTFEDMGVPQAPKQDGDCVSAHYFREAKQIKNGCFANIFVCLDYHVKQRSLRSFPAPFIPVFCICAQIGLANWLYGA